MVNFETDQAEGLRRMLGGKRPRVFTFLSALQGHDKALMLMNLCSSLACAGSDVVLLDAFAGPESALARLVPPGRSLADVAAGRASIEDVVERQAQGFSVAALQGGRAGVATGEPAIAGLERAFAELSLQAGTVIIDSHCDVDQGFPLRSMAQGEIVIQVTPHPASIKEAYGTIKRLNAKLGRRPFSVLVTGASEDQACKVFDNMATAASRYLAVSLEFIGSVPTDDHVKRAAGLGRPVTDAFPLAVASVAFRRLAQRFALSDTWREASHQY